MTPNDSAPRPPHLANPDSTAAVLDARFSLANERTFLAWVRTGLSLIAAGGASVAFLADGLGRGRLLVALPLIALGAAVALRAHHRWRDVEGAMERGERLPVPELARTLSLSIAILGVVLAVLAVVEVMS